MVEILRGLPLGIFFEKPRQILRGSLFFYLCEDYY